MEENGQLQAPAALPAGERAHGTRWIEVSVVDVKKRKSLASARNRIPVLQPIAHRYITELSRLHSLLNN
jgi:hypothetical protein